MENIQQTTGESESKRIDESKHPVMRDLFKKFFGKVKGLNTQQKVTLAYKHLIGKNPSPTLDTNRKLDRILYELEFGKKIEETKKVSEGKKTKFKLPNKWKGVMKKSKKAANKVLVFYMNIKNEVESPKLLPIFSGNMVIIKNKPYEVDPRAFWTWDKYKCLFIKEIDRRPVSNLDLDEIKARGDATDSDEFLIKAAMKAIAGGFKKPASKAAIIFGIVAIVVVIGIVMANS